MTEVDKDVKSLIKRAEKETDPHRAMQLSQAALNAAHAIATFATLPNRNSD